MNFYFYQIYSREVATQMKWESGLERNAKYWIRR